jgi:hypothetical protein
MIREQYILRFEVIMAEDFDPAAWLEGVRDDHEASDSDS